ncbi:tape measure protein [Limoniibacter endophyticus]|uniref:Tail protein n=1 Tax=Limoniibacter endophyticus TaxID=1565040 RepID=A0A8J3DLV8_9HYPH|nr:tape measure protein [Limoniibacter endophyticus]GHC61648.1 tail protein [Limoniibacter endophyticus]
MAVTVEELRAVMRMEMKPLERDLQKIHGINTKAAKQVENTWRNANRRLDGIGQNMARSLAAPLAGVTAVLGIDAVRQMTDTWTDLSSRVQIAAGGVEQGAQVMERLGDVARRTYSSLETTAEGYLLNATAMRELGYSTSQTLDYTEAVNNALVISGAKGQRAESVINALSKAMAAGKLSGDELNTVITTGGRVAEALAAGLGVSVNQLRSLGQQGKITGNDVVRALSTQMERLRREAEGMPATIGDGIQLLQNAMLQYVGSTDQAYGASARISEALVIMADNFDKTADVALQLAGVIAGALIGRSLLKMISTLGLGSAALVNFTKALLAARSMASLGIAFNGLSAAAGPVGLLVGGALVTALTLYSNSTSEASAASKVYAAALEDVRAAAEKTGDAVEGAAQQIDEKTKNALSGGIAIGVADIENARDAVIDLFDHLLRNVSQDTVSPQQIAQLEDLRDSLNNGTRSADEVEQALFALANSNPDFQAVANAFSPLLTVLRQAIDSTDILRNKLGAPDKNIVEGYQQYARTRVEGNRIESERNAYEQEALRRAKLGKAQLDLENEIARVRTDAEKQNVQLTDDQVKRIAEANLSGNASRSAEGKKPKKERENEYQRLTERIVEQTAAIVAETEAQRQVNPLVDDYGYAVERARAEQELLNAAKAAGLPIDEKLRQEIAALADQYAVATVEAAKLGETQDDIRRKAEEMADFQKDLSRGIVDGFMQGKKAADIFADALSKVGNKLLDMAFNAAFDKGGGSWLGNLLGGLFGGGGRVSLPASGPIPALRPFSDGGYTGPGGKYQPAGIVHKGEVVWSQRDVRSHGGVAAVEALRRGYANGGAVGVSVPRLQAPANQNQPTAVTFKIDVTGARGNAEIQEMVQQGVAQGIQHWSKSSDFVGRTTSIVDQRKSNPRITPRLGG